jgi:D-alanine--poly(phosphoribitol) ligase subunit 1
MIHAVYQYLENSAQRHPNKIAVKYDDLTIQESITFQELNKFATQFACHLQRQGSKKHELVGIYMPKRVAAIKAMFSILKAGNAYVPFDIHAPTKRLVSTIQSSNIRFLIVNNDSQASAQERFNSYDGIILINIDEFHYNTKDDHHQIRGAISVDLAYVLFTSGSTGVPKGVMIPHKAIDDYIQWCVKVYKLDSTDHIANHAPLYFDNSTFDIYTAMFTGATLHLVPDSINKMLPSLLAWLTKSEITVFFCVPSVLGMLLHTRRIKAGILTNLKQIICAGEVLHPTVLRGWMKALPHVQFANMYGPTEITVDCTYHIFTELPDENVKHLPIGKARFNIELFILSDEGVLTQEKGARGELYVRGEAVAYGYLNNAEQTESSFVQNPQQALYSDRLYRTGDVVELSEDGVFYFLGRKDSQVKFLGHRIELGEVEATISNLRFVEEVVVIFKAGESPLNDILGCAIKLNRNVDPAEINMLLKEALPAYMLPNRCVLVTNDFPRTPSGKYDRNQVSQLFF